jgi:hypothetical protein
MASGNWRLIIKLENWGTINAAKVTSGEICQVTKLYVKVDCGLLKAGFDA